MAAGIVASYAATLTIQETLAFDDVSPSQGVVTHNGFNTGQTFNSTTTPPGTKSASHTLPMVSGAAIIDLTALVNGGSTIDGTGLKVQCAKFQCPATNGAAITVKFGAATPWQGLGASFTLTIPAGGEILFNLANVGVVIGPTHKDIDISGTGTDALNYEFILG